MAAVDGNRANSRAALLAAAFEEFTSKGYEAATVAGIAARAGVTTGALYAHFDGKLDLLLATVALTPVEDILRSAGDIASRSWEETATRVADGLAAAPHPSLLLLLDVIVVARREPRVAAILRTGLESYLAAMTAANDAGVAVGHTDPVLSTADLARTFALLQLGKVVVAALDGARPSPEAFGHLARALVRPPAETGDVPPLDRVRRRADAAGQAAEALHDAVADAVRAGHPLRAVADAAGISHERVRQIARQRG